MNNLAITERLHLNEIIEKEGIDFATGVPCGVLKDLIFYLKESEIITHIISQNEPEAVGIAAGAYLGGKKPLIYMQNSGFMKSINEFSSLIIPCRIPVLCVISLRGKGGEDAPQHALNGKITKSIIDGLGIESYEAHEENMEEEFFKAAQFMKYEKRPAIIIVKRKDYCYNVSYTDKPNMRMHQISEKNLENSVNKIDSRIKENLDVNMEREDALDVIISNSSGSDAIFSTTGLISRSLYERHDSPNQYYNTGSFGLVSSLGFGFATAKPDNRTIVIDGDSSLLTNFNTLVTIGHYRPKNLLHIVLDNNAYGSCSGEESCSMTANFGMVAALQGYNQVYEVNTAEDLRLVLEESKYVKGPCLVHAMIGLGGRRNFKRPKDLSEMTERFKWHFNSNKIQ